MYTVRYQLKKNNFLVFTRYLSIQLLMRCYTAVNNHCKTTLTHPSNQRLWLLTGGSYSGKARWLLVVKVEGGGRGGILMCVKGQCIHTASSKTIQYIKKIS